MVENTLNRTLPCAAARLFLAAGLMCLGGLACGPTIAAAKASSGAQALPTLSLSQAAPAQEAIDATGRKPTASGPLQLQLADDHAGTQAEATLLQASSEGSDSRLSGAGQLGEPGDADMFKFFSGDGSFSIEVSPSAELPRKRLRIELHDNNGTAIASVNPRPGRPAVLGGRLKAGQYYLLVNLSDSDSDRSIAISPDAAQHAGAQNYSVGGIVPHPGSMGVPEALALADYEVGQAPRPVKFDGTGIESIPQDIVSWRWDFGDGNAAVGANASHTYAAAGTYTATLTITDRRGYTDTDSVVIAVDQHGPVFAPELTATAITSEQPPTTQLQRSELAISTDWEH